MTLVGRNQCLHFSNSSEKKSENEDTARFFYEVKPQHKLYDVTVVKTGESKMLSNILILITRWIALPCMEVSNQKEKQFSRRTLDALYLERNLTDFLSFLRMTTSFSDFSVKASFTLRITSWT